MVFSMCLSEEERMLAESYAKSHSYSIEEAFKRALFEKIEDESDLAIAKEAYAEYKRNPVTVSHADMWKEIMAEL